VLGGTLRGMGPACSHRPLWPRSPADAAAPAQRWAADITAAPAQGGLLVVALGFCSVLGCDDLTDQQRCWVTRLRHKIAYRTVQGLRPGPAERDEILQGGPDRSPPWTPPRRLVSVLWPTGWDRSRPQVREPHRWAARQVGARYRRRGRSAEAWARTKRGVAWAYGWTGATQAVPWPRDATLIVEAVWLTSCQQGAQVLGEPWERLSVARVLRAFYPYRRAVERGAWDALGSLLAAHAQRLGMVKRWRQPHRERQPLESIIWGDP